MPNQVSRNGRRCLRAGAFLLALAVGGCSSVDSRIHKNSAAFASYPADVQQKIKAKQIDVGFTMEQVQMALGEAEQRYVRTAEENGQKVQREVWGYPDSSGKWGFGFGIGTGSAHGSTAYGGGVALSTGDLYGDDIALRVIFANGRVQAIERRSKS